MTALATNVVVAQDLSKHVTKLRVMELVRQLGLPRVFSQVTVESVNLAFRHAPASQETAEFEATTLSHVISVPK
jgi:hypothetical protein